jgi:hypothetical protein
VRLKLTHAACADKRTHNLDSEIQFRFLVSSLFLVDITLLTYVFSKTHDLKPIIYTFMILVCLADYI